MRAAIWSCAVKMMTGTALPCRRNSRRKSRPQVEVEQHQLIGDRRHGFARVIKPLHPVDTMSERGDVLTHGVAQHMVVFDQQYAHSLLLPGTLRAKADASLTEKSCCLQAAVRSAR